MHAMSKIQVFSDLSKLCSSESVGEHGYRQVHVDLANAGSKSQLLEALKTGMELPDYFGRNWDALEECLRDLDKRNGWLVVFENADSLLSLPRSELSTFIAILFDTAEFWSAEGRLFRFVFIGSAALAAALEDMH